MTSERDGVEILSRSDCLNLLGSARLGRLGVSMEALPVIQPVEFEVVDDDIVIRTAAGTRFEAAATNAVVAFEVDGHDPNYCGAWSVLVQGVAEQITDPVQVDRFRAQAAHAGAGVDGNFVRISTRILSGRRVAPAGTGQ